MSLGKSPWLLMLLFGSLIAVSGCATTAKSVSAGAILGAVVGAGMGSVAYAGKRGEGRFQNFIIGTTIGSAMGAGAGWMLDHSLKDKRLEGYEQGKKDAAPPRNPTPEMEPSGTAPKLLPPRTDAKWVPDQVRGSTFIPGHFEYFIIDNARWERSQ